jgi:hypothetical protein
MVSLTLIELQDRRPHAPLRATVSAVDDHGSPGRTMPSRTGGAGADTVRVSVTLLRGGAAGPVRDRHLRVHSTAPHHRHRLADVLVRPGAGADAAAELAWQHPGALVIAAYQGPWCWLHLGAGMSTSTGGSLASPGSPALVLGPRQAAQLPWELWASLAHTWLVGGLPAAGLATAAARLVTAQPADPSPACRPPGAPGSSGPPG